MDLIYYFYIRKLFQFYSDGIQSKSTKDQSKSIFDIVMLVV